MKELIAPFSELGRRLAGFGGDAPTQAVIERACRANGWFTPSDIRRAVGAIRTQMLDPERLAEWMAAYPALPAARPRRVLVIAAGNIPLVGFFDLLCVLISGHRCAVKPSAKDRVLMEHIVGLLREIDPGLPVECCDGETPADAVIATGSDNANRYFRMRYKGIPSLLRGSRQSAAVLSGHETPEQLAGLADDIRAYSGLGCRNVSMVLLPHGYRLRLPLPPACGKFRNNYLQTKALLEMQGRPFIDLGSMAAVEQAEFPAALSMLSYTFYRTEAEAEAWLAAHDDTLQCVVSECVRHSRRTGFGQAQSPALTDYPDDVDVPAFLSALG